MAGLTRRRFLGAAAGAAAGAALAAALPGCSGARDRIPARLRGEDRARGHLLRGAPPASSPAAAESTGVAILGGGVAGLAAAWALERSGFGEFLLLEQADEPGGTSRAGANPVSPFPWGAHYLPVPHREQRALCRFLEEAGVTRGFDAAGRAVPGERHLCRAPQERTFHGGAWHEGLLEAEAPSPAEREQRERFEAEVRALAARRDGAGRRAFALPVDRSSRDPDLLALDRISMAAWMDARGLDHPRLRWYVEYACRDDFGCLLPDCSAWAALHYFASRVEGPGDGGAEFLTWPEGNGFLVRLLAAAAAGRVRTGALALRAAPEGEGARVLWGDAAGGEIRALRARRVICALPRFAARRVVEGLDPAEEGFRTTPWVTANLTLRRPPAEGGYPLCWDNVIVDSPSLGYVVATHQSDRPGPRTVWTWYRPFCGPDVAAERRFLETLDGPAIRDMALDDLLPAHPDIEEVVESVDGWIWGHGMVRPEPGFLWGGAREAAALPRGPVHFAAADLGGLPLFEEAHWHGVRAAEEAMAALGHPFESLL